MNACCIQTQNFNLFLFGKDGDIELIKAYVRIGDKNKSLTVKALSDRLSNYEVYGYATPETIKGIRNVYTLNKELAKCNKKVRDKDWDSAVILIEPEKTKRIYGLNDDEIEKLKNNFYWKFLL